jgi:hypothetical protein
MLDTPDEEFISACGRPLTPSQLVLIPAATTNESYEILRPEAVVTEDEVGENV